MKKVISIIAASLILVLVTVTLVTPALAGSKGIQDKAIQITTNPRYDRNPSFLRANDGTYWLFWARGQDSRGIRNGYNPDLDYYDVYYKTAKSIPGLEKAKENLIPLQPPPPFNAQRDIAAVQASDGTIWVFVSTGLGPGEDRYVHYYTYDGSWHGPVDVPYTDYAAHISAVEDGGKIWVFFDYEYKLWVVSYDEADEEWSSRSPVTSADSTIAKAILDNGNFYVVWTTSSGAGIYLSTSTNGIDWSSTPTPIAAWPSAGTSNWDPVLIKDKDLFRLFWAPDAGTEGQFIATSTSADPTDPASWSAPVQLTTASYGSDNNWWDFWPQPYDKGAQYLLYTSERNSSGTARADGNIWMAHLTVPSLR